MVHQTTTCSKPLPRFLHLNESCLQGNGKQPVHRCTSVNVTALRRLSNASLLFFGDSTAYRMLENVCKSIPKQSPQTFVHYPMFNRSSPYFVRAFRDVHHQHDHHFCRLLEQGRGGGDGNSLGMPVASLHHYGVISGEPLWYHAYPRPPWLGRFTTDMARGDAPAFCAATTGCEPTMVVINSAFWDLSAWWMRHNSTTKWRPGPPEVADYIDGVRGVVAAMRHAFPTAVIAWRTAHGGMGHGISAGATHTLNQAIIAYAPALGLQVIDIGGMIDALAPRSYLLGAPIDKTGKMKKGTTLPGVFNPTFDGRHLNPYLDMEAFNLILAELERAWDMQPISGRYPACSKPAPLPSANPQPAGVHARRGHADVTASPPPTITQAEIDALPPGRRCASHALPARVTSVTQLYVPLPEGERTSGECGRHNCTGRLA